MRLNVPQSDLHTVVEFVVKSPVGGISASVDTLQKTIDIQLPEGVPESSCAIDAYFVGNNGKRDESTRMVIQVAQLPELVIELPKQKRIKGVPGTNAIPLPTDVAIDSESGKQVDA